MIQDRNLNRNVDTNNILSLLSEWDAEYCMDTPSKFHMIESYVLKNQGHDPYNPTHMEALSGENSEEYFKAINDESLSLIRRNIWEIVSSNSVADQNMLPVTWSLKCKRKPDWTIRKFKARYCVRGDIQKRLSSKPLN